MSLLTGGSPGAVWWKDMDANRQFKSPTLRRHEHRFAIYRQKKKSVGSVHSDYDV